MDDPESIIKELRVDWENVLSEHFNPLHLALRINTSSSLASDFRDMYHKLEFAMEKIIATNFKGFSDSVLSYNEFNRLNKQVIDSLQNIIDVSQQTKQEDFDIKNISSEKDLADFYKIKYSICCDLQLVKQTLFEFEGTHDILKKAHMVIECLDTIDNMDYIKIKGVDEYRKMIYEKYVDLVEEVNRKILDYVFKNNLENIYYFKCTLVLGSLYELELYFKKNFKTYLFNEIENAIVTSYKATSTDLEDLCRKVAYKIGSIRNNMSVVISKVVKHFDISDYKGVLTEKNKNFFGKEDNSFKFCTDISYALEIIKSELDLFISKYSNFDQTDNLTFDMGCIVDTIKYDQIYGSDHPMSVKLLAGNKVLGNKNNGYSVVVAPRPEVVIYLAKYTKDYTIKAALNQKIETTYSKYNLERSMGKVDLIFNESPLKINLKTRRLIFYEEIESFFEGGYQKHQDSIKKYLDLKVYNCLTREYTHIFTSDIIKTCINFEETEDDVKKSSFDEKFKEAVTKRCINKKDLFLNKQKYQQVVAIINTLKSLDSLLFTKKIRNLYRLYLDSFKYQLNLEFFYFYDLFYRQGNYYFYIKNIIRIFRMVYDEARTNIYFEGMYTNIEHYSIKNVSSLNVRSKSDLKRFVDHLRILDEIMGEIEFYSSLGSLYKFYESVLAGESDVPEGIQLQKKIGVKSEN